MAEEKTTEAKKEAAPSTGKAATAKKPKKAKSKRRSIVEANVYVKAGWNNTIISVGETNGNVVAWATSGSSGFKGTRKSTPYAAQVAAENAVQKAKVFGLERVHVFINGAGPGREQALRGIIAGGVTIESITNTTQLPHNGCRKKKARRV